MSFALRRLGPLLVLVRHNRAANTDPNLVLVDTKANTHFRAAAQSYGSIPNVRDCAAVELSGFSPAFVELLLPSAILLLKMMGHHRNPPNVQMLAK